MVSKSSSFFQQLQLRSRSVSPARNKRGRSWVLERRIGGSYDDTAERGEEVVADVVEETKKRG
jgi:hypothetical protein